MREAVFLLYMCKYIYWLLVYWWYIPHLILFFCGVFLPTVNAAKIFFQKVQMITKKLQINVRQAIIKDKQKILAYASFSFQSIFLCHDSLL